MKPLATNSSRRRLSLLVCCLVLTGCSDRKATYPVSGKVVWKDGSPATELAEGFVTFDSAPLLVSAMGKIEADGTFKLGTYESDDGVPAGEYQVAVTRDPTKELDGPWVPLKRKYEAVSTSELTVTVEAKANNLVLELEKALRKTPGAGK